MMFFSKIGSWRRFFSRKMTTFTTAWGTKVHSAVLHIPAVRFGIGVRDSGSMCASSAALMRFTMGCVLSFLSMCCG